MACGSTAGFSSSIRLSGTPVLSAIPPSVSPTCTVYVLLVVSLAGFFVVFEDAVFFVVVLVFTVVVVADSSVVVLVPPPPELVTIARKATSTAISAKGATKRAGLLLVR